MKNPEGRQVWRDPGPRDLGNRIGGSRLRVEKVGEAELKMGRRGSSLQKS
jgi:hypothetical protein